jgi:hypothetical protein
MFYEFLLEAHDQPLLLLPHPIIESADSEAENVTFDGSQGAREDNKDEEFN